MCIVIPVGDVDSGVLILSFVFSFGFSLLPFPFFFNHIQLSTERTGWLSLNAVPKLVFGQGPVLGMAQAFRRLTLLLALPPVLSV